MCEQMSYLGGSPIKGVSALPEQAEVRVLERSPLPLPSSGDGTFGHLAMEVISVDSGIDPYEPLPEDAEDSAALAAALVPILEIYKQRDFLNVFAQNNVIEILYRMITPDSASAIPTTNDLNDVTLRAVVLSELKDKLLKLGIALEVFPDFIATAE